MSGEQNEQDDPPRPMGPEAANETERQGQVTRDAREAMDRLNESNRVLVEARMLPRGCKLTQEQINGVIERYIAFTKANGITAKQAAREVGYSKSVLSE